MFRWLNSLLHRSQPLARHAQLTFGSSGSPVSAARGCWRKNGFGFGPSSRLSCWQRIAFIVGAAIERTMCASLSSELQTLVTVQRSMLETWLKIQESNAQSLANDPQVREIAAQIVSAGSTTSEIPAADRPSLQARLSQELAAGMSAHHFVCYLLADKEQRIIAANTPQLLDQQVPQYESFLRRALEGQVIVSPPFPSVVVMPDEHGQLRAGIPTIFVAAPIRDEDQRVVAVLALRVRPEREFTQILQMGRPGETGETYAINKDGLMVSNSRFDEQLIDVDSCRTPMALSQFSTSRCATPAAT